MNQPPEWPLPADGLRPMPSPYRSAVSSASPEFDQPVEPEPAAPVPVPAGAAGQRPPEPEPDERPEPAGPPEPDEDVGPAAPAVGTAAVPRAALAAAPPSVTGSVPPPPGAYQPPDGQLFPVEPLPAPPLSPVPLSPAALIGYGAGPRRALPPGRIPAVPPAISGPPARAISGPPSRIAAPAGSSLPFGSGSPDRPRMLKPATIVTPAPPPARRVRGLVAFVGILLAVLVLGATGVFWALPVYGQTRASVVAPDNLIGLPKLTDSGVYARFNPVAGQLTDLGVANPVIVGYLAPDDRTHLVVFAGGAHAVWFSVGRDLDRLIAGLGRNPETAVPSATATDPGPLGGAARCGAARGRTPLSVCGWQDHGTVALLFFANRGPDEAAVLLRAMRPALEQRTG